MINKLYQSPTLLLLSQLLLGSAVLIMSSLSFAADITVEVRDSKGKLLSDAVVYIESSKTANLATSKAFEIEQKGRQFNPQVSVVQAGTQIHFPNKDKVRHHVYSFSPAKKFELKLYSGVPANPVLFDKAGTVVLGCNIHDTMLAYVHIVDTPYFAKTDASGVATISHLPEGSYELKVWHYALQTENKPAQQAITIKSTNQPVVIQLDINDMKLM
jgi:plastocyanin